MISMNHSSYTGVRGYATADRAQKRGEEVAAQLSTSQAPRGAYCQWVVIVLANGRFAPCFVVNSNFPGGPGLFIGLTNVCVIN